MRSSIERGVGSTATAIQRRAPAEVPDRLARFREGIPDRVARIRGESSRAYGRIARRVQDDVVPGALARVRRSIAALRSVPVLAAIEETVSRFDPRSSGAEDEFYYPYAHQDEEDPAGPLPVGRRAVLLFSATAAVSTATALQLGRSDGGSGTGSDTDANGAPAFGYGGQPVRPGGPPNGSGSSSQSGNGGGGSGRTSTPTATIATTVSTVTETQTTTTDDAGGSGGGGGGGDVETSTPSETATPTATPTETATPTPTATATETAKPTETATPTATVTPTPTQNEEEYGAQGYGEFGYGG
jgi:hypothetical protein